MKNTLIFRNTVLETISHNGQIWFTSAELAKALQYSSSKSVSNLYNQNRDEFTEGMSLVIDSVTNGINNSLRKIETRIFSLRGAHLIAMFANTPVAKEFRKWCLDILDKAVGVPEYQPESPEVFNGNDLNNLARLVWEMSDGFRFDNSWRHGIWSALRQVTGIPSPKPFQTRHIPLIAEECVRIFHLTNRFKDVVADTEKQVIRRVIRQREDADNVISEMNALLEAAAHQTEHTLSSTLEKWQQRELTQFLHRG